MATKVIKVSGTAKADAIVVTKTYATVNGKKTTIAASGVTVRAGKGNDTITINSGGTAKAADILYGDAGKDTFVIGKSSTGIAVVKDFNKSGTDKVKITGAAVKSVTLSGKNLIIKGGKSASLTLEGAKGKTISLEDSRGKYTMSSKALTLDKAFKGTLNSSAFLSSITKIDGSKGTKTVTVNAGKNIKTVTGGSAVDKINLNAGTATVNTGAGNDVITVKGGNKHTLRGGVGSDRYVINSVTKGTRITINQSDYKAKDADTLKLASVNKADVTYSLANGTLTVKHKTGGVITVQGWDKNKLSKIVFKNGEVTASKIEEAVTKGVVINHVGDEETVNGTERADTITVKGDWNKLYGNAGNDTMEVISGDDNDLYGGEGNDTIKATAGKYHHLYGEAGNDKLEVVKSESYSSLSGGSGDDTYTVHWPLQASQWGNSVTIDHGRSIEYGYVGATNGDKDNLIVKGAKRNDVNLYLSPNDGSTLVIEDAAAVDKNNANKIYVSDWFMHGLDSVQFDDTTISAAALSDILSGYKELKKAAYDGSVTPVFSFEGRGWAATLTNTSSANSIDFSNYNEGSSIANGYGYGEAFRDGNDLMVGFERKNDGYTEDAGLVGTVTVQDYFTSADRMSSVVWHNPETNDDETLHVMAGDDNTDMSGTAGRDVIFTGSGTKTVSALAGDDTIVVGWSSKYAKHYATGTQTVNAGDGDDKITVGLFSSGGAHTLNGGAGNDDFTAVQAGWDYQNLKLNGGDGNDSMAVKGSGHTLNGNEGDDWLNLEGENSKLYGGAGMDNLYINGGKNNFAYGGADDDSVSTFFGTNDTLYGEVGDDYMDAMHSTACKVYGGAGDDTITVGGKNNEAYGEAGNDTIRAVSAGVGNDFASTGNKIRGGLGSDTYEMQRMVTGGWTLTIDQQDFAAGDKDILVLEEYNKGDAVYAFKDKALSITLSDSEGMFTGTISVTGWTTNKLDKVVFADGEVTGTAINQKVGL